MRWPMRHAERRKRILRRRPVLGTEPRVPIVTGTGVRPDDRSGANFCQLSVVAKGSIIWKDGPMRLPGFMAEVSLTGATAGHGSCIYSESSNQSEVVAALTPGGYACLAVASACARGSKQSCTAVRAACRSNPGGSGCFVSQGGWVCNVLSDGTIQSCYLVPTELVCDGVAYSL